MPADHGDRSAGGAVPERRLRSGGSDPAGPSRQRIGPWPDRRAAVSSEANDIVIDVEGLHRSDGRLETARGVSLQVRRGELFALLGTNGAGKTTIIEMLEGLQRPSAGRVRVLGLDPAGDRPAVPPRTGVMLQDVGVRFGGRW